MQLVLNVVVSFSGRSGKTGGGNDLGTRLERRKSRLS